jgi:ketosteroid isomerase-like protein
MKFKSLRQTVCILITIVGTVPLLQVSNAQSVEYVSAGTTAAINTQNARYMTAFSRRDAVALAKLHSKDGTVLPPKRAPINGRAAIESMFATDFSKGAAVLKLTTIELRQEGELLYETGAHQVRAGQDINSDLLEEGSYLVIWKQNGEGIWQLYVDIWNLL